MPKFNFESNDYHLGLHFGEIKNSDTFKKLLSNLENENAQKNISFEYKNDCNIQLEKLEEYIE